MINTKKPSGKPGQAPRTLTKNQASWRLPDKAPDRNENQADSETHASVLCGAGISETCMAVLDVELMCAEAFAH